MRQSISIQKGSNQIKSLEVNGFRVTNAEFPSQLHLPIHLHEVACFAVVLWGAVNKVFPQSSHELLSAGVVTMPAHEKHSDLFGVGKTSMLVVEPVAVGQDLLQPCAHLFDLVHELRDEVILAISHRIRQELFQQDTVSPLVINGLTLELLALAARRRLKVTEGSPPPHWLKTVQDYLHTYFQESFQLADVAQTVNVHPVHLSRVFRVYFGTSVGNYVRQLRLEWVTQQLTLSNDSLAQLAQKSGFTDQSHLTRTFKQYKGITPSQFRREMAR